MNENLVESLSRVNAEISEWRTTWVHKNPCKEWSEHKEVHGHGFCKHLVDVRYRMFGKRLEQVFSGNNFWESEKAGSETNVK